MKRQLFKLMALATLFMSALNASSYEFDANGLNRETTGSNTVGLMRLGQHSGSVTIPSSKINETTDYDFTYFNLKFAITGSTTVKCVGTTISSPSGSWDIPDVVPFDDVDYRVTEVGEYAFYYCSAITSFSLGNNVKEVGMYSFYGCSSLASLDLAQVETIRDAAFGDCSALKQVTIPNTVTHIGEYAFGGGGLEEITIPASVTSIKANPFFFSQSLAAIHVDSDNQYFSSCDGVLFNKDQSELICYPSGITSAVYDVPQGVTAIGYTAMAYNNHLERVTLPSSLTRLDYYALEINPLLTNVNCLATTPPVAVSSNVFQETIGNSGLTLTVPKGCKDAYQAADVWKDFPNIEETDYDFTAGGIYYNILTSDPATVEVTYKDTDYNSYSGSVTIPETVTHDGTEYTVTSIGMRAFQDCLELTAVTLPSTIKTISYMAFYNCSKLASINLPEGLTTIDTYAFYYCTKLPNVKIPSTVTLLNTYAFCGCQSFTKVIIPNSVRNIGYGAFYDCDMLTTISIGSGVTWMGADVFKKCPLLTSVTCLAATPPSIQSNTFELSHYSNVSLVVCKGSLSAYQSADYWSNFSNMTAAGYDFMVDGIYYNITGTNPATVEVTYRDTGYNSYSGAVNVPGTVTNGGVTYTVTAIGNSAFRKCADLTSLTLPGTITDIKPYAFYYCDGLTSIDIPDGVTTIHNEAFWICLGLTHVTIPNSVTSIGYDAFRNCSALTSVVIGKNVATIGSNCFLYDPLLTDITCLGETPPAVSNTANFFSLYEGVSLHVPYGSHETYRNAAPWNQLSYIVSEQVINPSMSGDVNGDGKLSIGDVTSLISYLLSSDASGINMQAVDVNGDGKVSIGDVTELISMLLSGTGGSTSTGTARTDFLINSVPFTMVKVEGGTFMMGMSDASIASPVHQVTLSDYSIGETEVTQALWQTVMNSNPSYNKSNANLPVENMTWDDCQTFVGKLSQLTGKSFGLPTEAQWEFAARGGNKSQGYTYSGSNNPGEVAWYQVNSGGTTHPVGTKVPNELGLYDMSGNVFEWCQDYWGDYTSEAQTDPQGPTTGEYRVCRSSGYNRNNDTWLKCGGRTFDSPTTAANDTGLRLTSH